MRTQRLIKKPTSPHGSCLPLIGKHYFDSLFSLLSYGTTHNVADDVTYMPCVAPPQESYAWLTRIPHHSPAVPAGIAT